MNQDEATYRRIAAYLADEMPAEEKAAFEAAMEQDPELELAVSLNREMEIQYAPHDWAVGNHEEQAEAVQALKTYFQSAEAKALQAKLVEVESQLNTNTNTRFLSPRRLLWLAAAVVIGILCITFWPQSDADRIEGLYAQFAMHEPLNMVEKGADEELANLEKSFNGEAYAIAIPLLESYLETHPERYDAQLALGIALLETNQIMEARDIFTRIAESEALIAPKAQWYMVLSCLKMGDFITIWDYLNPMLENTAHPYHRQAKEVKASLDDIFKDK